MNRQRVLVLLVAITCLTTATPLAHSQDQQCAIYVMRPDGSDVRRVATTPDHQDHCSPRWSHDGKQIAFDAAMIGNRQRQVFVINVDGTGLRNLGNNARPDWSPDDKQLAYEVHSGRGREVHVQNADGTGQEKVADGVCGRWSPDGSRLAVTDYHNIRVVDLLSGEERAMFDEPYNNIYGGFSWSPDGKLLAITVQTPAGGGKRPLLLVNTQDSSQAPRELFVGGQGGAVSFSPDGKRLVFDNGYMIHTRDIKAGSQPRLIPGQKGRNKDPHWSPDGQWIVFSSDRHAHE